MVQYDIFVLVLCFIVFAALTVTFTVLVAYIAKMQLKMIRGGLVDDELVSERCGCNDQKNPVAHFLLDIIVPLLICVAVIFVFIFAICVRITEKQRVSSFSTMKVVNSSSMAVKYEKNGYLDENSLDNQFQKFDLIMVEPLPKEEDIKLYDIVVYESDGYLIIHRIVKIEEPNDEHSERYFMLRGDANEYSDRFPVRYSQMIGIYRGNRFPFIGSFVVFMHSPAGYLCVLLVLFVCIALPLIEKKIDKAIEERLIGLAVEAKQTGNIGIEIIEQATKLSESPMEQSLEQTSEIIEQQTEQKPITPGERQCKKRRIRYKNKHCKQQQVKEIRGGRKRK